MPEIRDGMLELVLGLLGVALLVVVWVAVRRTDWHQRWCERQLEQAAFGAEREAERRRAGTPPPMSGSELVQVGVFGALGFVVVGVLCLVAAAVVVWAWRTVFG